MANKKAIDRELSGMGYTKGIDYFWSYGLECPVPSVAKVVAGDLNASGVLGSKRATAVHCTVHIRKGA